MKTYVRCILFFWQAAILFALPATTQAEAMNPFPSRAQCVRMDDGIAYYLSDAILFTPATMEQPSKGGDGIFYRKSLLLRLDEGQRLFLSGDADKGSGFHVDDLLHLEIMFMKKDREWDFRSHDFSRIIPVDSPQEISDLLTPGLNLIRVTQRDLLWPVFSSSPITILVLDRCYPPTVTPFVPTSIATATHTAVPTATETATALPTATNTPVRTMPVFRLLPTATILPTSEPPATRLPLTRTVTTDMLMQRAIITTPVTIGAPMTPEEAGTKASLQDVMAYRQTLMILLSLLIIGSIGLAVYAWRFPRTLLTEWKPRFRLMAAERQDAFKRIQRMMQQCRLSLSIFLSFITEEAIERWNDIKDYFEENLKK